MPALLLIIDPQIDFITGSLTVTGAENAMNLLAEYITGNAERYACIAVTLDQHPLQHSSFSEFGGEWPEHCIEHSVGAAIWPPLLDALKLNSVSKIIFLGKGQQTDKDEYSVFRNLSSSERLLHLISDYDISDIDICGIAGDICVTATITDGLQILSTKRWRLLSDFTPSIDGGKTLSEIVDKYHNIICDRL